MFQVFFVIRLQSQQMASNLPPIHDPDPHMSCELMDGRDNLLTLARDKHYEFSSLRRAKYSSIALLYELHNQGKESFVYTCNTCEAQVETRWHCSVCTVSCCLYLKGEGLVGVRGSSKTLRTVLAPNCYFLSRVHCNKNL